MGLECYYCGGRQIAPVNEYGKPNPTHHECPAMNGHVMPFVPNGFVVRMHRSAKRALDGVPMEVAMVSLSRGSNSDDPYDFAPIEAIQPFEPEQ